MRRLLAALLLGLFAAVAPAAAGLPAPYAATVVQPGGLPERYEFDLGPALLLMALVMATTFFSRRRAGPCGTFSAKSLPVPSRSRSRATSGSSTTTTATASRIPS